MLQLPVVLAVDRAGLVGEDGETHHGIYDVGYLRHAPGMKVLCPASMPEARQMVRWAVQQRIGPVAIRYPRGGDGAYRESVWHADAQNNPGICVHSRGKDVVIVTYGTLVNNAITASQLLHSADVEATVLRLTEVSPLPTAQVLDALSGCKCIVVFEEIAGNCGIREQLAWELQKHDSRIKVYGRDLGKQYIQHGALEKLYDYYGLSAERMAQFILEVYRGED